MIIPQLAITIILSIFLDLITAISKHSWHFYLKTSQVFGKLFIHMKIPMIQDVQFTQYSALKVLFLL